MPPHLPSAWGSASQSLKTWLHVGSEPQLCSQARPLETAFPSWIFAVSGFIKIQKAGSQDCVAFMFFCSSLWTSLDLEEKKGPVALLLLCFLNVACGCGGVKVLGLTHSSFGLFQNFCLIFKNNFCQDFCILFIRILVTLLSELFCRFPQNRTS